jgi:hypothetical protein
MDRLPLQRENGSFQGFLDRTPIGGWTGFVHFEPVENGVLCHYRPNVLRSNSSSRPTTPTSRDYLATSDNFTSFDQSPYPCHAAARKHLLAAQEQA